MILTSQQKDSLIELISIAFGRAAASLSDLTGQRVMLNPPKVDILPMDELSGVFNNLENSDVATVNQIFSGSVNGNALLMFDYEGAKALARLMSNGPDFSDRLTETDLETLTEVGNILLNACLGTFGNILQVHISFSVPRIDINSITVLLNSLTIGSEELQYALLVLTEFHLRDSAVGGYLVLVLGVSSLERLMQAIERIA